MIGYTETAIHWLNAYRLFALEPLIDLYDNQATQACSCDGPKLIAGKAALRVYWIDQFKTHPAGDVVGAQSEADGETLSFQTSKGVVRARLHMDQLGRILHVECGLVQ